MNKKKQYNAVYRLRKKGVEVSTPNKTVYAVEDISSNNTLNIIERVSLCSSKKVFLIWDTRR